MVNWSDPQEIADDGIAFSKVAYVIFGVYVWELFLTCGFEWDLIRGRRKFQWTMASDFLYMRSKSCLKFIQIFFLLCRYCMFFALVSLFISFSATPSIDCGALYTFISWSGHMTILCSTTLLLFRMLALWKWRIIICVPFGIFSLAQWGLLYRCMFTVRSAWDDSTNACALTSADQTLLNVTLFYTVALNAVISIFATFEMMRSVKTSNPWDLLFEDGLVYFIAVLLCSLVSAVFNTLNLNAVMDIIASVPATALSAIASCRLVTLMTGYNCPDVFIHSAVVYGASDPGNRNMEDRGRYSARVSTVHPPQRAKTRPEIHVTTPSFIEDQYSPSDSIIKSPYEDDGRQSHLSLDLDSDH